MHGTKEILERLLSDLGFALEADRGSLLTFKAEVWRAVERAQRSLDHVPPTRPTAKGRWAN